MCCPPINQHASLDDRISPESVEKMLDVIVAANLGPMPADYTDRVLSFLESQMRCNFEYLEYNGQPCGRDKAVQCQGEPGCVGKLCDRHVWICPLCGKNLCSWCFDRGRHECGRAA